MNGYKKFMEWLTGKKRKPEGYVPQSTSAHAPAGQNQSAPPANGPPAERPARLSQAQPTMDDPKA